MNKLISIKLMQLLLDLPYIDKFGGTVQTIQKTVQLPGDGDKIIKHIPVSAVHSMPEGCSDIADAAQIHFIPESKLKGMIYFEDNGVISDSLRHSSINFYRSRLRLVCWMNQKNLTGTYNPELVTIAINEIISRMPEDAVNYTDSVLKNFRVEVASIPPQTSAIFAEYDYNEKETQFLIPPYDFFAIDLDIYFGVPKGCVPSFTPIPLKNC